MFDSFQNIFLHCFANRAPENIFRKLLTPNQREANADFGLTYKDSFCVGGLEKNAEFSAPKVANQKLFVTTCNNKIRV